MPNILEASDAALGGKALFNSWLKDFEREWIEPVYRLRVQQLIATLPSEVRDVLQERAPEEYQRVIDRFGGLNNASNIPRKISEETRKAGEESQAPTMG